MKEKKQAKSTEGNLKMDMEAGVLEEADPKKKIALAIIEESVGFSKQNPSDEMLKWNIYSARNFVERNFTEDDSIASGGHVGAEALLSLARGIQLRADIKGDFGKSEEIAAFLTEIE